MSEQSKVPESVEPFRHEVFFYMDSDFCEECGCLLTYGESGLCVDCLEEYLSQDEDEDDWFWWEEDMYDENQAIVCESSAGSARDHQATLPDASVAQTSGKAKSEDERTSQDG